MKTYQKVLLGGAVLILLAGIALQIYISFFLEDQLKQRLVEEVRQGSDGEFDLEELDVSLLNREVSLSNIHFRSEDEEIQAEIEELNAAGIGLYRLWQRDELSIQNIEVINPSVLIVSPRDDTVSSSGGRDLTGRLAAEILDRLNELSIPEISLNGISFQVTDDPQSDPYFSINNTDVLLQEFHVDSSAADLERVLPVNRLETTLRNMEFHTSNNLYLIKTDTIEVSGSTGSANVIGAALQPKLGESDFFNAVGHSTDRVELELASAEFRGINFDAINRQESYETELVELESADLRIFHDKRYPEREEKQTHPMPQQMLHDLGFPLAIDTLRIRESFIRYAEHEEQAEERGEIDFSRLNATFTHITNMEQEISEHNEMVLDARAHVMDEALLNARFTFPLLEQHHLITGTVEEMDAAHLNRVLEPLAFIRVADGRILSLEFTMNLGEQEATGEVELIYEDLKLTLLNKGSGSEDLLTQAGTLLANTFVIKSDNHPEAPRTGEVSFERSRDKSVFNYWWKSLQSGLESSVGL